MDQYTTQAYNKAISKIKDLNRLLKGKMIKERMHESSNENIPSELDQDKWLKIIITINNVKKLKLVDRVLDQLGVLGIAFSVLYNRDSVIFYLDSTFRSKASPRSIEMWKVNRMNSVKFLTENIKQLETPDEQVLNVKCNMCSYSWTVVVNVMCTKVECPNCNNFNRL